MEIGKKNNKKELDPNIRTILIIGERKVGKTMLIKRYKGESYEDAISNFVK